MIYGKVYVLCLPQASKVNIWTLARFNEQNFSEISPKLYSAGDVSGFVKALCCLLIGPHRTKEAQRQTRACARTHVYIHTRTRTRSRTTTAEEAPFLAAQEGMMTLIIASKQDGHSAPTQQSY